MDLSFHYEKIVNKFAAWREQETDRASDAGAMREDIGRFLDLTGLNKKAVSFVRALDKMSEDKRDDVLRSLHPLLEQMDLHWRGNGTPDMLGDAIDPEGDLRAPSYQPDIDGFPDPDIAQEADDFDRHLAEVQG